MKLGFIVPKHSSHCGVYDFTVSLLDNMVRYCPSANYEFVESSSYARFPKHYDKKSFDLLHLNYPMAGFRKSFVPQLIALFGTIPISATLHEYEHSHFMRKLLSNILLPASGIVFTSKRELTTFSSSIASWRLRHIVTNIIPISSNIPVVVDAYIPKSKNGVVFFGLLRPNRGLEEFIQLASLSLDVNAEFVFTMVCAHTSACRAFADEMLRSASALKNVRIFLDEPPASVSRHLAGARFAYLPYPDGVSERRGSFVAALAHGAIVLTTVSDLTDPEIAKLVVPVGSPSDALAKLQRLHSDFRVSAMLQKRARSWLAQRTWQLVSARYFDFFVEVVRKTHS